MSAVPPPPSVEASVDVNSGRETIDVQAPRRPCKTRSMSRGSVLIGCFIGVLKRHYKGVNRWFLTLQMPRRQGRIDFPLTVTSVTMNSHEGMTYLQEII